jgi:hypothetical protein
VERKLAIFPDFEVAFFLFFARQFQLEAMPAAREVKGRRRLAYESPIDINLRAFRSDSIFTAGLCVRTHQTIM